MWVGNSRDVTHKWRTSFLTGTLILLLPVAALSSTDYISRDPHQEVNNSVPDFPPINMGDISDTSGLSVVVEPETPFATPSAIPSSTPVYKQNKKHSDHKEKQEPSHVANPPPFFPLAQEKPAEKDTDISPAATEVTPFSATEESEKSHSATDTAQDNLPASIPPALPLETPIADLPENRHSGITGSVSASLTTQDTVLPWLNDKNLERASTDAQPTLTLETKHDTLTASPFSSSSPVDAQPSSAALSENNHLPWQSEKSDISSSEAQPSGTASPVVLMENVATSYALPPNPAPSFTGAAKNAGDNTKKKNNENLPSQIPAAQKPIQGSPVDLLGGAYLIFLNNNEKVIDLDVLASVDPPNILEPIYLSEAVAFSLQNNYEVLASESKVKQSGYKKIGSYTEYAPTLQVSRSKGREYSAPATINDSFGNRILESTHSLTARSVTVRQPLIDLNIISDILSAHTDEKISKDELRDTRESTAFDTANNFLRLIQSHIAIELADQYKSYLDDLAKRMAVRVAGGGATQADLERIKGRLTIAESAKVEALGEYRTNLSEFVRLTKVVPAKLQIPQTLSPSLPENIEVALERAHLANPAYRGTLKKVDAAADERNKNASTLLPKLSLQYDHNFTHNAGGSALGNPVDGVFPNQTTNSTMLVASWTLNGGTNIVGDFSAREKENEMRFRAQDVRTRLEHSIRTGYEAVNAAHGRINILQDAVKANSRVVQDFELQFKEGNRTLFDVLDAYEQLYNSKLNLMRLVIAEAQASFQIRRQMGDLVEAVKVVGEK